MPIATYEENTAVFFSHGITWNSYITSQCK